MGLEAVYQTMYPHRRPSDITAQVAWFYDYERKHHSVDCQTPAQWYVERIAGKRKVGFFRPAPRLDLTQKLSN